MKDRRVSSNEVSSNEVKYKKIKATWVTHTKQQRVTDYCRQHERKRIKSMVQKINLEDGITVVP